MAAGPARIFGGKVASRKKEDMVNHGRQNRCSHRQGQCDMSQVYLCHTQCVTLDRSFTSEAQGSRVVLEPVP